MKRLVGWLVIKFVVWARHILAMLAGLTAGTALEWALGVRDDRVFLVFVMLCLVLMGVLDMIRIRQWERGRQWKLAAHREVWHGRL